MIFHVKRAASACLILLAALLVSVVPRAYSQIPMRGFNSDLSSTEDTFLSLDLNGDGKADMLYSRPGGGYAGAYLSHGDGTFHYVSYVYGGTSQNGFTGDLTSTSDTFVPLDLNGDGKSDFIEYRPGGGDTIRCLSRGDGTVNCNNLSVSGTDYYGFADSMTNGNERIVTLDMNHDGLADFVVYTPGGGSARLYLTQANSSNLTEITLTSNGAANPQTGFAEDMKPNKVRIVPLDYNGDGYTDLLVYTPQYGEVRLYQNTGYNTFQLHTLSYGGGNGGGFTGNSTDSNAHAIALDLNGDGKQDFLWWQAGSKTVIGFLSNGNGTVTPVNYLTGGTPANGFQDTDSSSGDNAVALDLNGDGKSDFIWYSPGNSIVTAYTSSSTGAVTAHTYRTGTGTANNFQSSTSTQYEHALPLNFLGTAASGFAWYVPGSETFQAYTANATNTLNYYNFYAYPGSFLSDMSWSVGNLPLKEIVMPGTHDAAMYGMRLGEGDGNETQWGYLITDQLAAGARSLDFRFGYYIDNSSIFYDPSGKFMTVDKDPPPTTSDFYMYGHSTTLTNDKTLGTLNNIEDWLVTHPGEVVILRLTPVLSGSNSDETSQFVSLLQQTDHPDLIYTPLKACGSASCTNPILLPQNTTIATLMALKTRLILISGLSELNGYGWTWNEIGTEIGYCDNYESGRSTAIDEIDCINNASNESGSDSTSINVARPLYQAADAATSFMTMSAVLTPGGYASSGQVISLQSPLTLADGSEPYGFNVGSQQYDVNQQLANGAWNSNALNFVRLDGLRAGDAVTGLIIQRNHQSWVNKNFFNNTFAQPAGALSIGAKGDVWAAGSGHSISIFKYVNGAWKDLINSQPNVKKLAVDPQGGVWVVDGSQGASSTVGNLWHYDLNGQNGVNYNKLVQDVSVGADGSVWLIENSQVVAYLPPTGNNLLQVPSQQGTHIAVDNRGYPWVIDTNGHVQKFNGSSWQQVSGAQGKEIVAGADGSIFITGYSTPSVARYNVQTNNFDFLQMDASHIAVEPGGQPWAIRTGTGAIYKGSLDQI